MAEPDLLTTRHDDLAPYRLPIIQGETLSLQTARARFPKVGSWGYHAALSVMGALGKRTEGRLTLVEVSGFVDTYDQYVAGLNRKTLKIVPQEKLEKRCRLLLADTCEARLVDIGSYSTVPEHVWDTIKSLYRLAEGMCDQREFQEAVRRSILKTKQECPEYYSLKIAWMQVLDVLSMKSEKQALVYVGGPEHQARLDREILSDIGIE